MIADNSPFCRSAWIGLGANLGDARQTLTEALKRLNAAEGVEVVRQSSFYRTAPVEATGPDYTNAVAELRTVLAAEELLQLLLSVEKELGRVRPAGAVNAPRTIDLDLELYGTEVISRLPFIAVPHPRMHLRRFVLEPLLEIAPDAEIPGRGRAADFLPGVLDQALEKLPEE